MSQATSTSPPRDARFIWHGLDARGHHQRGVIIAIDIATARSALKRQRIIVLKLTRKGWIRIGTMRATDVTLFSRQLASLLQAGLSLLPALEVIANSEARPTLTRTAHALARDIAQGLHFSAALARYPKSFSTMYCRLVALGEASGALAPLLTQLADERERAASQKAKLRAALSYPAEILLIALAITLALMIWVVPTFQQMFEGFGATLPAPTQFVISLSAAVTRCALPIVCFLSVASAVIIFSLYRSPTLRLMFDRLLLALPLVGPLFKLLAIARWSRGLGLLHKAGTPLSEAFETLLGIPHNAVFDRATAEIARRVRHGERLANAMRATGCFSPAVIQPIAVAEESGALESMLSDLAALNDRQVDERITTFASLVEPLMMVILGMLVGGLVIAMYLPIIQLGSAI